MGNFICHLSHDYLCKGITMIMKLSMHNDWISRTSISEIVKRHTYSLVYQQ